MRPVNKTTINCQIQSSRKFISFSNDFWVNLNWFGLVYPFHVIKRRFNFFLNWLISLNYFKWNPLNSNKLNMSMWRKKRNQNVYCIVRNASCNKMKKIRYSKTNEAKRKAYLCQRETCDVVSFDLSAIQIVNICTELLYATWWFKFINSQRWNNTLEQSNQA